MKIQSHQLFRALASNIQASSPELAVNPGELRSAFSLLGKIRPAEPTSQDHAVELNTPVPFPRPNVPSFQRSFAPGRLEATRQRAALLVELGLPRDLSPAIEMLAMMQCMQLTPSSAAELR